MLPKIQKILHRYRICISPQRTERGSASPGADSSGQEPAQAAFRSRFHNDVTSAPFASIPRRSYVHPFLTKLRWAAKFDRVNVMTQTAGDFVRMDHHRSRGVSSRACSQHFTAAVTARFGVRALLVGRFPPHLRRAPASKHPSAQPIQSPIWDLAMYRTGNDPSRPQVHGQDSGGRLQLSVAFQHRAGWRARGISPGGRERARFSYGADEPFTPDAPDAKIAMAESTMDVRLTTLARYTKRYGVLMVEGAKYHAPVGGWKTSIFRETLDRPKLHVLAFPPRVL
ncbi:hypothetical protein LshimejAT787_0905720 [Lyophyllum shimeji]|uniref:Uncharacterized protein n=1 Tax=Lyophyllum shimeji TaxID=47721 RepID=A0A9P3PU35_LYOSH|nr:hypothetical protein LshimejAT787_0905720 [Lyophyllum shimeji]